MSATHKVPLPFSEILAVLSGWKPDVIFDVGANVGQSAVSYAKAFPNAIVHSFEPVPSTFEKLIRNLSAYSNVIAHRLALGNDARLVRMTHRALNTQNKIVDESALSNISTITVDQDSGAAVAAKLGIKKISFLKIDTEGHDYAVLQGFAPFMDDIEFIQVEAGMNAYNTTHVNFRILEDFLRNKGFYLFKFYDQTLEFKRGGRPVLRRSNPVFINKKLVDIEGIY